MINIRKLDIALFLIGIGVALLLIHRGLTDGTYRGGFSLGLGIGAIFFQLLFLVNASSDKCTCLGSLQE